MVASFIEMLMVARLGKPPLAAGALATITYFTVVTIVATALYSVGILIGHHKGQNSDLTGIAVFVKNGFWLSLLLSIPSGLLLWNVDKVLLFFGQQPQLVALTVPYFHYGGLAMLPMLVITVIIQFHTGIGRPRFSMIISLIRLPITVLLSYALILGKWGVPSIGLAGIMCSSLIVQSLFAVALVIYLGVNPVFRQYGIQFSKNIAPSWQLCRKMLLIGLPIGLQFGGELAARSAMIYLTGHFGVVALAASQIVSQYVMLWVMVSLGLSQAVAVLVSMAYGKRDYRLVKQYIVAAATILAIISIVVLLLILFGAKILIGFYVDAHHIANHHLVHLATLFLYISCIMLMIDGSRDIFSGGLRGMQDSKVPMIIGVLCLWLISLPLSYIIGFYLHGGAVGLRIGFGIGITIAMLILFSKFNKRIKSFSMSSLT